MHKYKQKSNNKIKNQMEKYLNNLPNSVPKNVTVFESYSERKEINDINTWLDKFVFNLLILISFFRDPLFNDMNLNKYRKLSQEEIDRGPIKKEKYYIVYEYNYFLKFYKYKKFNIKAMSKIDVNYSFLPGLVYYVKRRLR